MKYKTLICAIILAPSLSLSALTLADESTTNAKKPQHHTQCKHHCEHKHRGKAHHGKRRGMAVIDSRYSVVETMNRLEAALHERGLTVFAKIDHAANAGSVELTLRPTQVILFGNPKLGTPLMQTRQSIAIDLPQKMAVWEDEDGQVKLAYNKPRYLARRHKLRGAKDTLTTIGGALDGLAKQATGADSESPEI